MRKIGKILIATFIFLLTIVSIDKVNAATHSGRLHEIWWEEANVNVFAAESNGWMDYNGWQIKSTADSKTYYCIDPAVALEGSYTGAHTIVTGRDNIISKSNLTSSNYNRVLLLSYYGYGYKDSKIDHTSKKWYGITQVQIWRAVRGDLTWTFKNSRYGSTNSSLHASEIKELNNLVNTHNTLPSFSSKKVKVFKDNSVTLTDTNNIFHKFSMSGTPKNVTITKSGNKITIKPKKIGTETIKFTRTSRTENSFTLYDSSQFQEVVSVGKPTLASFNLSIEVTGRDINIQKVDEETKEAVPQGDATLNGAIYEVYDSSNNLQGQIVTGASGVGKTSLNNGTYTIKEVKTPKGYKLSDKEYNVTITSNNTPLRLTVSDEVIKGEVKITKKKGGTGEEYIAESGAEFDIIDRNGDIVEKLVTDENGVTTATLPYGKYTIKQTKGEEGYVFSEDIEVNITEEKLYEFEINNVKLSKLDFTKRDFSSGKELPNTLIEVYKENDELIFSGRTNENGKIEVPNLEIGKYYILEKEAPKYYLLNEEKMWFEVLENGQIIKSEMKDTRKEGILEFTKTDSSGTKFLRNALIEIYFTETNEKVFKGRTDKNGKIVLEGLIAGKYCIYEKEAPKGYELDKKPVCFEILEQDQKVKVSIRNNKIVKVPDTNDNSSFIINIVSITLVLGGTGYIVYEKRKH